MLLSLQGAYSASLLDKNMRIAILGRRRRCGRFWLAIAVAPLVQPWSSTLGHGLLVSRPRRLVKGGAAAYFPHFLGYVLCTATVSDYRGASNTLHFTKATVSICNLACKDHFELSYVSGLYSN